MTVDKKLNIIDLAKKKTKEDIKEICILITLVQPTMHKIYRLKDRERSADLLVPNVKIKNEV